MKNERLLTPIVFVGVLLAHIGFGVLLWHLRPEEHQPQIDEIEFVDLSSLGGSSGGGAGGKPEDAPAPPEPPPTPPPEKKQEKPKKKEQAKPEKPKIKPVITKKEKADIRVPKEKPKEEPKPEKIKPEPKPEPKPETKQPSANAANKGQSDKPPLYTAPDGKGGGQGQGKAGKSDGKGGEGGSKDGTGKGNGKGDGDGDGNGKGNGIGDGQGSSAGNPVVKAGGRLATPPYPSLSQENSEEGTVIMDVLVEPSGRVSKVTVVKSSGYNRLDTAAKKAAQNGHYQTNGRWVNYKGAKIIFKLD